MSNISLREYVQLIENLIDQGDTDQAIGHCKHILNYYPKHIDTYRLLGKAFLEKQRFGDAADIFERVLSATPDDFIAQIGMSIIREDENNLDGAIWHMERAFEIQPSNKAVQDELRRLYANRDGVAPPKIRLTRGALVRMYTRGELFTQAIAEIRAALIEDPNRIDLEVILARLYFLMGKKVEATEICSKLIGKLPYCYEANRILSQVLKGTSRAEDGKIFQQRVNDLDPYAAYLDEDYSTPEDVPQDKIMIDKLDWDPNNISPEQPDWAQTIGIAWEEESEKDSMQDWFSPAQDNEKPDTSTSKAFQESKSPFSDDNSTQDHTDQLNEKNASPFKEDEDESIPDWMKAAGWQSTDQPDLNAEAGFNIPTEEKNEEYTSQIDEEEKLEEAEIPDWLHGIAPEDDEVGKAREEDEDFSELFDELEKTSPSLHQKTDESDAGWLKEFEGFEDDSEYAGSTEAQREDEVQSAVPDWMKDLVSEDLFESEDTHEAKEKVEKQEIPETPSISTSPINLADVEQGNFSSSTDEETNWLDEITAQTPDVISDETEELIQEAMSEIDTGIPQKETPEDQIEEEDLSWLAELSDEGKNEIDKEPVGSTSDLELENVEEKVSDWFTENISEETEEKEESPENKDQYASVGEKELSQIGQKPKNETQVEESEEISEEEKEPVGEIEIEDQEEFLQDSDIELSTISQLTDKGETPDWLKELQREVGDDLVEEETLEPLSKSESADDRTEEEPRFTEADDESYESTEIEKSEPLVEQEIDTSEEVIDIAETIPDADKQDIGSGQLLGEKLTTDEEGISQKEIEVGSYAWLAEEIDTEAQEEEFEPTAFEELSSISDQENDTHLGKTKELKQPSEDEEKEISGEETTRESADETAEEEIETELPEWIQELNLQEESVEEEKKEDPFSSSKFIENMDTEEEAFGEIKEPSVETVEESSITITSPEDLPDFFTEEIEEDSEEVISVDELDEQKISKSEVDEETVSQTEDFETAMEHKDEDIQETISNKLEDAKLALKKANFDHAVEIYNELVRANQNLDEVINDIQEALNLQYPIEVSLWQTLGDAFVRKNEIQNALDAYSKAEDLIF